MSNLQGQVAFITGAAHPLGIGRSIANHLGSQGAKVIIGDIDKKYLESAVYDLKKQGIESDCYDIDVSRLDEVQTAVEKIIKAENKIDILVNNVGGTSKTNRESVSGGEDTTATSSSTPVLGVSNATPEQWEKIINVNLNSVIYCSQAVLPHMKKRQYGRIVNFASVAGQRGVSKIESFTSGPYSVAKAAVIGLTRQLAIENAEHGINVNAVSPGFVKSARGQALDDLPEEHKQALLESIPQGRFAESDEVASVVLGLCTSQFQYVTGQTINVNGGMYFS
ncbi:SDR family NAD(P)-dependent oxidoreductase [Salibacterium aidingense]|uniref:SDR family NAD(P)-dependent oxidoreductase n=1 Tax=Salibacterium aidingense TaxID=384933 RepID=UPI0004011681|nr:SDR family NAD(P)-dependent oxidoreductase [Salibacterium aidingense]